MKKRNFNEMLQDRLAKGKHVCVGLDSDYDNPKFPESLKVNKRDPISAIDEFNREIIHEVGETAAAYKLNLAFYLQFGPSGIELLQASVSVIKNCVPEIPIILDAKFGDIGNTNRGYVKFAFDYLEVDAVTLQPYMGKIAMQPFLERKDKGLFVLCRTSNRGSNELQGIPLDIGDDEMEVYKQVAINVRNFWNENSNCGLVVGATAPRELGQVTHITKGKLPVLLPGVGAQGGDLKASIEAGSYKGKLNMIINLSRGVIFKSSGTDYAKAAVKEVQRLNEEIELIKEKI